MQPQFKKTICFVNFNPAFRKGIINRVGQSVDVPQLNNRLHSSGNIGSVFGQSQGAGADLWPSAACITIRSQLIIEPPRSNLIA